MRDISDRDELVITAFYAKRIPCSCLDERYAALKAQPKMGRCSHCKKRELRSNLMLCGGCNFMHYCSRDCQRADWKKGHKLFCAHLWDIV
eukprot:scaffold2049_cov108-Cylindrotheca_fusiformis.AAC.10